LGGGVIKEEQVRSTAKQTPSGGRPSQVYFLSEKAVLKVITKSETEKADQITDEIIDVFIDYRSDNLQPVQKALSTLEILELALVIEKKNIKLAAQVEDMIPKVEVLDLIATSDGSMCISNTAKDLQLQPKDLFAWLSTNNWIYKRKGNTTWTAYQDKINQGLLEHKVEPVTLPNNRIITTEQVRVTSKGLAKLAYKINEVAA